MPHPTALQVHKFGGTSVKDAPRIVNAAKLLIESAQRVRVVAVSSALGGITNRTLDACHAASEGNRSTADEIAREIRDRHEREISALDDLLPPGDESVENVRSDVLALFGEFEELLHGTSLLKDLTPRTSDRIVVTGEKVAVRLIAFAIRRLGVAAVSVDADSFLQTGPDHGRAEPLAYSACPGVDSALTPLLEKGEIPVVTGFCGRSPTGATTTLGRGGSDLSATLIAAALDAREAVIWTDVPGVFSADPRVVPEARRIDKLHVREASEMSYYGAKVLHSRTMIPVVEKRIPVWIKSSLEPEAPGTRVDHTPPTEAVEHPVKAVSAIRDQAIIEVLGNGMVGVPGIAGRVFSSLAEADISVTMISQSSSEASVCLAVPMAESERARSVLRKTFEHAIHERLIEDVKLTPEVGLVAVVGLGMAHTPGVASRVFVAIAQAGINVLAIAQGSSELNISLAVTSGVVDDAVRALHAEFI